MSIVLELIGDHKTKQGKFPIPESDILEVPSMGGFVKKAFIREYAFYNDRRDYYCQISLMCEHIKGFKERYKPFHHAHRLPNNIAREILEHIDIIPVFVQGGNKHSLQPNPDSL